jgi:hypothetical protein
MERFVVGTGRCGSTLLSLMLAEHRDVVSLHEFFTGLDWGRRFASGHVDGATFAGLLGSEQRVTTEVLARGLTSDEIQYPFERPGVRFAPGDPVPWLLITVLSRLTDDPDPLFDDTVGWAEQRPDATMAEHYTALFDRLTSIAGGTVWVERSGSSLDYLGDLDDVFPDARFVHIHRDGHEAALSIRNHPFFRLGVAVLFDLFPAGLPEVEQVDHVIATAPPYHAAGQYWCDQVLHGFAALPALDRDQFLSVRFEDLLADPRPVLGTIATFFELDADPAFLDRAAARVHAPPRPRFGELSPDEQVELRDACRAGQVLLGRG